MIYGSAKQHNRHRHFLLACISLFVLGIALACGSGDSEPATTNDESGASSSNDSDDENSSIIIDNGRIYTIEDFEAAGYKAVTEFDIETLPTAIDAWFGFYSQKDFELRFYPSHQDALDEGVEPAEVAIGKGAVPWQKQPPVRFFAYAVVGNVVMLCEREVASCKALIAELD